MEAAAPVNPPQPRKHRPGRKHMPIVVKTRIIELNAQGFSYRQIGRMVDRDHTVVSAVIRKWTTEQALERKKGSGPRRKTDAQTDRLIRRAVEMNRSITLKEIQRDLGLHNICIRTISNRIAEAKKLPAAGAAGNAQARPVARRAKV